MFLPIFAAMSQRRFIQVIVPLRLEWEPFYYYDVADDAGEEILRTGDRVLVPFSGKEYVAVVSNEDASSMPDVSRLSGIKPISGRMPGLPPVGKEEIKLWRQVAAYYLCTVGEVCKAACPSMLLNAEIRKIQADEEAAMREQKRQEELRERRENAIIRLKTRLEKKREQLSKARMEETKARYAKEIQAVETELNTLIGQRSANVQSSDNQRDGGSESTAAQAAESQHNPNDEINLAEEAGCENQSSAGQSKALGEISLTPAQEKAYAGIREAIAKSSPALLWGVTGSGKTEIYLKLALEVMAQGKNVLYLVPEIALSRQLEERLELILGDRLMVFHSEESPANRVKALAALRDNRLPVMVLGTRSAVFLPHRNLGLVIVDEEHDTSYKQDNPAPRYNGRETAIMLAANFGAGVVLGSATPSLDSLYNCSADRYALVRLTQRYYGSANSDIEIIDTIAERRKNGMVGSLSRKLISRISKCLEQGRQAIILRDRKAYATLVQCSECGEIPKCRNCNVSLSLHQRPDGSRRLICHYCGKVYEYTGKCRSCGGDLRLAGAGTEKVEEEISAIFPNARVARLDGDVPSAQEEKIIRDFSDGEIDVLVGTRIVAKGFDFRGLSLVAVLQADSILGRQDFRADERAVQLLEQFRGRCGRRGEKGLFVIQTSAPEHPVYSGLLADGGQKDSLESFMQERRAFGYPPYSRLISVIIKDYDLGREVKMSEGLAAELKKTLSKHLRGDMGKTSVAGPYSPAIDKVSRQYVKHVRISLPKDKNLLGSKSVIYETITAYEKENRYSGHISIDVDPV